MHEALTPAFDSHAHLTDERFAGEAEAALERSRAAGVVGVISIGTDVDDSRAATALASDHPDVFASVGIHPHAASGSHPEALSQIEEMSALPRVVAIGETGLDYHYDNSPREQQRSSFLWHLELGRRRGLPVVVHSRDADDDLVALLREAGTGTRGVLHSFSRGAVLLETALELGWYVSFSGMITFKSYAAADLLRSVPLDRLMVETDSPYLAPVPLRGRRNEPAFVPYVAARAAELRGEEDRRGFAETLLRNTREFFQLEGQEG